MINQLALGTEQTMDSTSSLLELAAELPKMLEELGVEPADADAEDADTVNSC